MAIIPTPKNIHFSQPAERVISARAALIIGGAALGVLTTLVVTTVSENNQLAEQTEAGMVTIANHFAAAKGEAGFEVTPPRKNVTAQFAIEAGAGLQIDNRLSTTDGEVARGIITQPATRDSCGVIQVDFYPKNPNRTRSAIGRIVQEYCTHFGQRSFRLNTHSL